MNYQQFQNTIKNRGFTIFSKEDIALLFDLTSEGLASLLRRYKEKGYLQNPKRGVYFFTEHPPEPHFLAYKIYNPSYISFESALSHYGIIPEIVYSITSATTKPTRIFTTKDRSFTYTKIKQQSFAGFIKKDNYLIAESEKAFVDYTYLVALGKKSLNDRLNIARLDKDKIRYYTSLFDNNFLNKQIWQLLKS